MLANAGDPGSIPGQGTRSCIPQLRTHTPQRSLKILRAAPKTQCSQMNKKELLQWRQDNLIFNSRFQLMRRQRSKLSTIQAPHRASLNSSLKVEHGSRSAHHNTEKTSLVKDGNLCDISMNLVQVLLTVKPQFTSYSVVNLSLFFHSIILSKVILLRCCFIWICLKGISPSFFMQMKRRPSALASGTCV